MIINPVQFGLAGKHKHKDTKAIQQALNLAKKHPGSIVYIPAGTYHIKRALTIFEGTTLFLNEAAVLQRHGKDALLKNGYRYGQYHGYRGNGHLRIIGGTFDMNGSRIPDNNTAMCIGHAEDIVLYNVTIKDVVGGHGIDACGVDGLIITRCNFEGFLDINGDRSFSEAIQLDIQVPGAFPKFGTRDGTITKNVSISECYFGPSETPSFNSWNRAIGSHATRHNQYYEHLSIFKNTFHQTGDYALTPLKAKDVYIMDNHFIDCTGGIRFLGTKDDKNTADIQSGWITGPQSGTHVNIINNRFDGNMKKDAVHIRNYKNIQHQDVVVADNVFNEAHQHLHLEDIDQLIVQQPSLSAKQVKLKNITNEILILK
ncbi:cell wall surface anchor family protein [Staphylococcus piscifermentans]|uniref:Pectate lyase n=1 Tax=Staphylococcus piscifermentans TaxID=70258 RepID=A0A239TUG3_9STAP|nr:glycosyl hydrolase family 28-related protein [Staphylococcus piscifermentans]RTX83525.1 pectate lyase [Staphylococcus piscifermentans]GEP84682.1 pectate lyase [Staphylococcus piscifermentans]SNV01631.1 cell wall surface anchor family protein [Staphylococcus piscifermentans]